MKAEERGGALRAEVPPPGARLGLTDNLTPRRARLVESPDVVANYLATYDCGHFRSYEAANTDDVAWLQDLASHRLCPECAYEADALLILTIRSS